jgi:hypothetical protein
MSGRRYGDGSPGHPADSRGAPRRCHCGEALDAHSTRVERPSEPVSDRPLVLDDGTADPVCSKCGRAPA